MKNSEKEKEVVKISRDRALKLKYCAMKRSREHNAVIHRSDKRAKNRLMKTQSITAELHELKVNLAESEFEYKNLENKIDNPEQGIAEIRKERDSMRSGKKGGALVWPLWMLQLVLEILVNGTPPASIQPNIASHIALLCPDVKATELPSI